MLNIDEFYPTPVHIINKMIEGIDFKMVKSVLEPSAGKGDICDIVKEKLKHNHDLYGSRNFHADIDTIEMNTDLQHILKGKGYRIVHDDFLSFNTYKKYDLIIMNPPFSEGEKHLLKALEMQEEGGNVICLLNAETLRNTHINARKTLKTKLEEYNADIEYIQNAFVDAERKTAVEVALIKVNIPAKEKPSYFYEQCKKAAEYREPEEVTSDAAIMQNDFIKEIVRQYNIEAEAGIKLIKEYIAMKPYILGSFKKEYGSQAILKLDFSDTREYDGNLSINEYIRRVRKKYWEALFSNPNLTGLLTTNLRNEYLNRVEELREYDFSVYNIYTLRCEMNKNLIKGVEETILNLFDEFSHKYSWYDETSKNIHYYTGWKTNKAYIINKKIIIPLNGFSTWDKGIDYSYSVREKLSDIEKVFNYLDGGLTETVDLDKTLETCEKDGITSKIPLKYFYVTFYKKGTCHIEFKNLDLLKKFNLFGGMHKNFLPPVYGKKKYKDMTAEEKEVINNFEGEASYNETMANKDYFIFNTSKILMLNNNEEAV